MDSIEVGNRFGMQWAFQFFIDNGPIGGDGTSDRQRNNDQERPPGSHCKPRHVTRNEGPEVVRPGHGCEVEQQDMPPWIDADWKNAWTGRGEFRRVVNGHVRWMLRRLPQIPCLQVLSLLGSAREPLAIGTHERGVETMSRSATDQAGTDRR